MVFVRLVDASYIEDVSPDHSGFTQGVGIGVPHRDFYNSFFDCFFFRVLEIEYQEFIEYAACAAVVSDRLLLLAETFHECYWVGSSCAQQSTTEYSRE